MWKATFTFLADAVLWLAVVILAPNSTRKGQAVGAWSTCAYIMAKQMHSRHAHLCSFFTIGFVIIVTHLVNSAGLEEPPLGLHKAGVTWTEMTAEAM